MVSRTEQRLSREQLQSYWNGLSASHLDASADGLEVICYAGMPPWFNQFIHRFQTRAFERLVRGESFAGCDVLDVGAGVGRWSRWYAKRGAAVIGIDIEPQRLARAQAIGGGPRYELMPADELAFADASFDAANSITVLQHVDDETKRRAISEIARVLRPRARVTVFEVTDLADDAPHVFPWTASQWRSAFAAHGFAVRREIGTEYIPLLRALKRVHRGAGGASSRDDIDALKAGRRTPADRAKIALLRAAVTASYPLELASGMLPPRFARVHGFLFERGA
jgi:SAM-dependent methyltransferase